MSTVEVTDTTMTDPTPEKKKQPIYIRLWPIYIIAAGFALAISQGWHNYLTLDSLAANAQYLDNLVSNNLLLVLGAYILIYAAATAFMVPGSALTIAGGFLFPVAFGFVPIMGTLATVVGATLGASILFMATKTSIGSVLRDIAGPFLGKMEKEFNESPFSYMFAIRLIPAVPWAVANIAPALLGAKYRDYFITTFFGIIPGTAAYTWIGSGLKGTLLQGGDINIASATSQFLPAFALLAVVSLIPIAYKKFIKKSDPADTAEA